MRRVVVLVVAGALLAGLRAEAQTPPTPLDFEAWNLDVGAGDPGLDQGVALWTLKLGTSQHLRIQRFTVLFDEQLGLLFGRGAYETETFNGSPAGLGLTGTLAVGYSVVTPSAEKGGFELMPFAGAFYEFDFNFKTLQLGAWGIAAGAIGTYWLPRMGLRQYGVGVQFNADFNFSRLASVFYPGGAVLLEIR